MLDKSVVSFNNSVLLDIKTSNEPLYENSLYYPTPVYMP